MRRAGPQADKYAGGHRSRVTPVPIPNTEVKPATADGTVWETVWESRSLPAVIQTKTPDVSRAFLSVRQRRANGVGLCFIRGATLPDSDKLLLGSGNQTRFIRLESAAVLERPEVE